MAKHLKTAEMIMEVQRVLGEQFALILSGMTLDSYTSTGRQVDIAFAKMRKAVDAWQSGSVKPPAETERRFEIAYSVIDQLREAGEAPQTIRSWFMANQPDIGDEPPILFLADSDPGSLDVTERLLNSSLNGYLSSTHP